MRPFILATVLALAASPAFAYCPSFPDNEASHYVENQRALMLCQQQELAAATAQRARELQYQSDMLSLQIQLQQQLKLQQQLQQQQLQQLQQQVAITLPQVTFPQI